jgi:SAM-dependent methyltransferase
VNPDAGLYVTPLEVDATSDYTFYHVLDLPGHGTTEGEWDLRGHEAEYLGNVDLTGKRVLEIGPASGGLTFFMEKQGADVVAFDIAPDQDNDQVPYAGSDRAQLAAMFKKHISAVNRGWWLAHHLLGSHAKLALGTVYELPLALGQFDVVTFNAVLLHLRDPFLALQRGLEMTTETVIVTDVFSGADSWRSRVLRRLAPAHLTFLPDAKTGQPQAAFWSLSPEIVQRMIGVLGFERSEVTYHSQRYTAGARDVPNFTVVGHRTVPIHPPQD